MRLVGKIDLTIKVGTFSASDRTYWDGWESKAMFMKPDGAFTTENVYITAGDSVCIVVLVSISMRPLMVL